MAIFLSTLFGLAITFAPMQDDSRKAQPLKALPPHPFDAVFGKANSANDAGNGVLKSDVFRKACEAGMKAKKEQEERLKNNPGMVGPTPAQAARVKFLEILNVGVAVDAKPPVGIRPPVASKPKN